MYGAAAGLLGGLTMLAFMAFLRLFFFVASPTEMIFDRAFPFVTVKFFIDALVRAGGYSQLKLQGVYGALGGQLAAATVGGVVYALFVRWRARAGTRDGEHAWIDPRGWLLIVPGVLGVWALFVGLLWPQLLTNYHGRPPAQGDVINALGMLASFGVCGVAIMIFHGLLTTPPRAAVTPAAGEPSTAGLTRRRFLAGGFGALAAVALAGMLRRLYQLGSFNYDGTQYGGPEVQKITPTDKFYQVTKNLVDPDVARDIWRFDIVGNVETPRVWTFHELTALPAVEQETTMQCISYGVGSGLISNAIWKGIPLPTLLAMVKPKPDSEAVLFHAGRRLLRNLPPVQGERTDNARRLGNERRAAAAAPRVPHAHDRAGYLRGAQPQVGHPAGVSGEGRSPAANRPPRHQGRGLLHRAGLGTEHLRADDQPDRRPAGGRRRVRR